MLEFMKNALASLQALVRRCVNLVLKVPLQPKPLDSPPKPPRKGKPYVRKKTSDRCVPRSNGGRHDSKQPSKRAKNAKASRTKARDE